MELPFVIEEPLKIPNSSNMTWELYQKLYDTVIINKKYNNFLKNTWQNAPNFYFKLNFK